MPLALIVRASRGRADRRPNQPGSRDACLLTRYATACSSEIKLLSRSMSFHGLEIRALFCLRVRPGSGRAGSATQGWEPSLRRNAKHASLTLTQRQLAQPGFALPGRAGIASCPTPLRRVPPSSPEEELEQGKAGVHNEEAGRQVIMAEQSLAAGTVQLLVHGSVSGGSQRDQGVGCGGAAAGTEGAVGSGGRCGRPA